ncbi:DUF2637 domain-containing protein [Pseudarthrobacter sp. J1738]|uniref:DUF2637 domain-containing protein n=1 Tax=Micrococcales TaxID=85006 RepID=UPI003B7FB90C
MNGQTRSVRLAVVTAIAGTVLIALGAFWLSFTALADLARRSGISARQAWAWPLIVDGIIVVATVAVVALAGQRAAWYPWVLLMSGAAVSVTANAIHAVLTADTDVPAVLAAAVAAVPPVVLLAITHLTVILTRSTTNTEPPVPESPVPLDLVAPVASTPIKKLPTVESAAPDDGGDRREQAAELRAEGWSNKKIARELGVHPSTVGRWLPTPEPKQETDDPPAEVEEERTP